MAGVEEDFGADADSLPHVIEGVQAAVGRQQASRIKPWRGHGTGKAGGAKLQQSPARQAIRPRGFFL